MTPALHVSASLLVTLLLSGCAAPLLPLVAERGIEVTGTGRVARRPDVASISVGVEARTAQLAAATMEVDRAMRDVLARVRGLGVRDADIRTVRYAIEPVAEPRRPGETGTRIAAYRVSNVVQVRTRDVDAIGRIVDGAVAAGANVVGDIAFALDDPARAEAEARALALQDAAAKASQLAATAGVRLGRDYPHPIVDHAAARERALLAFERIKTQGETFARCQSLPPPAKRRA